MVLIGLVAVSYVNIKYAAALVADAHAHMTGAEGGFSYGLKATRGHSVTLFKWALLNLTVGLVLSLISEAGDWAGQIASAIGNAAWRVTAWLVLPCIVIGDEGPIDALKTSAKLLRETWGERIIASMGFGFLVTLAVLPGIGLLILGMVLENPIFVVGIAWVVLALPIAGAVVSALTGVFKTALYLYATTGEPPEGFESEDIRGAFRARA
jgi:hypothetical protein